MGSNEDSGTTYGVIVDCGSSGTRANLYHWSNALIYPALLNDIEPMRNKKDNSALSLKKSPGLSSMKDEPEKSSEYMKEIMQFITENIPTESQSSTGVYIMATAGMRLLDKEIQEQIMNDIAKDILTRYNFAKVKTDVISGAQEGMYQWISVNSKAKRFVPAMDSSKKLDGKKLDGKKTFALIEMGGASIQVAYQLQPELGREILGKLPKDSGALPAFVNQIVEPNISQEAQGLKYELHSTTFLGLGSNSARDNYLDMLIKPSKRIDQRVGRFLKKKLFHKSESEKQQYVVKDPCMPIGSSEEVTKPKRMLSKDEKKTIGFRVEDDEETITVRVVGTGNYAACRKSVSKFLKLCKTEGLNCDPEEPCTMHLLGTEFVPFEAYEFLGLGEFYYTTLSMMELDGQYNHEAIVEKTVEMCELSIGELEKKYPHANDFDKNRSKTECFKAVFADTFLTEGLMMPRNYKKLTTVGKIGKDSIDWTLGAVLDKSLMIELSTEDNEDDDFDDYQDDYEDYEEAEDAEEEAEEDEIDVEQATENFSSLDNSNSIADFMSSQHQLKDELESHDEMPHEGSEKTDAKANGDMANFLAEFFDKPV